MTKLAKFCITKVNLSYIQLSNNRRQPIILPSGKAGIQIKDHHI